MEETKGKEEEKILKGYQKPIVLLERSATGSLPEVTAPGNPRLGIMLPYTPVHLMLFNMEDGVRSTDALIMTSGNISGDPICMNDDEAVTAINTGKLGFTIYTYNSKNVKGKTLYSIEFVDM